MCEGRGQPLSPCHIGPTGVERLESISAAQWRPACSLLTRHVQRSETLDLCGSLPRLGLPMVGFVLLCWCHTLLAGDHRAPPPAPRVAQDPPPPLLCLFLSSYCQNKYKTKNMWTVGDIKWERHWGARSLVGELGPITVCGSVKPGDLRS